MTVKLSPHKITRLLRMYLLGFSQFNIAQKIGVNQATVSLYVNEFSAMVEEEGLETAAKEFGIMDIVKELHSLGAELTKSKLSIEDAKRGLKAAVVLEECGVPEDKYKDVVATCIKMNNEESLSAAMELHKIEESSGMSFDETVKQASAYKTQLQNDKNQLSAIQEKIGQAKQTVTTWEHQKTDAGKKLQQYMEKVDVDFKRLEKIENLAGILKKAGVKDQDIDSYIERQNRLNKANISIDMFTQILDVVKVPTALDGGKNFLKKLTEFGGLNEVIINLKQDKQTLSSQVQDLDEKAKLRGAIQADITHLQVQKKELDGTVSKLLNIKQTTENNIQNLKNNEGVLLNNVAVLNQTVSEEQLLIQNLNKDIKTKQKNIADLSLLETKRTNVAAEYADLEVKAEAKKGHLIILEAFEGYMKSAGLDKQEQFVAVLPQMLKEAQQRNSSPDFIRAYIFKRITGGTLKLLRCETCNAIFYVDKPAGYSGYRCPVCGISYGVIEAKDEAAILREIFALTEPKIFNPVVKVEMIPSAKPHIVPDTTGKSSGNANNNG